MKSERGGMKEGDFQQARRLKTLRSYDILDTPPEPEFDDIALLITKLCDTPIGLVSFADRTRHWYKARVGMAAQEIAWDEAVCTAAMALDDDLMVVEDLRADLRFHHYAVVDGPPLLRFYASILLRAPDGQALGTLCAVDYAPRPEGLGAEQIKGLKALARHTMALLWFRSTVGFGTRSSA